MIGDFVGDHGHVLGVAEFASVGSRGHFMCAFALGGGGIEAVEGVAESE